MTAKSNISFTKHDKPEFVAELRSSVKQYFEENNKSKYGNFSIVAKSVFMMLLYFAPYVLMLTGVISSVPAILILWIIMGVGMAGLGMVLMHDANHRTYSKNQKTNNVLSKSMYLLGGFPPNWRQQHNTLHHGFTNIDGMDEDISPTSILRLSPHKPLYKIHKLQQWYAWFFYGLMTISWITYKDFIQLSRYKKNNISISKKKKHNQLLFDLIVAKFLYYAVFLLVPLIVIPVAWYWVLLSFFAMHFISGLILGAVFQTAHVMPTSAYPLPNKKGSIETNWAVHQLLTTSDYSPKSRVFSWFIGGLNYQVEHHLFPNISHVHYRKISLIVKRTAEKYDLPYYVQTNFLAAILNHFRMLKILGR